MSPQPARVPATPNLARIRQLWEEFHQIPFPRGSAHPPIHAMHRQLSQATDRVTALVEAVLNGQRPADLDALTVPNEFLETLAMAALHSGGPGSRDATAYHDYAQELRQFTVILRVLLR